MSETEVGIKCGKCMGHRVYVLTCNSFNGNGHDWGVAIVCGDCRNVSWTEGCLDCQAALGEFIDERHR